MRVPMNQSATTTRTMPRSDFTCTIQRPLFGSWTAKAPTSEERRTETEGETPPWHRAPRPALCVLAIQVRMPVSTGPVQGAAMMPHASPSTNAPL